MCNTYVLYNPLAGNEQTRTKKVEYLKDYLKEKNPIMIDVTTIESYEDFCCDIQQDDEVYLCGGDGTINQFVNKIKGDSIPCSIFYCSAGTGNDFLKDLEKTSECEPFCINEYLENLPTVIVEGKEYQFLNNVGFGIDGYCSEEGDKQKKVSDKPVNYTAIAIKGLLKGYKPKAATVTVDGKTYHYNKVWIAPTMKGRFYGGGMMAAPNQNRSDADGSVSLVIWHDSGKLRTLMAFPSIFVGEHINFENMITIHSGHDIAVEFDEPSTLQIDGETHPKIRRYEVHA